jgi:ATP-dependent exoDNAse (exonuclease V) beta subunit
VSAQRVSDPTAANVRVMTVHQSKGLQFDIVVLPDLEADIIGQPDPFVVDRAEPTSPIRGVCLYVNEHDRQLLPENIRAMFQTATDREVSESLCVLYVAMTRAIHALHMFVAPSKSSEKKLKRSFAGLLRAALTKGKPVPPEAILYETGDPAWFRDAGRPEQIVSAGAAASPAESVSPVTVRLAPARKRIRRLDRTSPSALEGGKRARINAVFHSREKNVAAARGTLWHAWLEHIRWQEEGVPDDDSLRKIAAEHAEDIATLDVSGQMKLFHELLQRPELAEVLCRQSYRPPSALSLSSDLIDELRTGRERLRVQTERRFAVRDDDTLLTGSIDRLVLIGPDDKPLAADVTDYKTDVIDKDDRAALAARVEYYRPQLTAYRRAVERFAGLPIDRIATRIVFLDLGIVVDL